MNLEELFKNDVIIYSILIVATIFLFVTLIIYIQLNTMKKRMKRTNKNIDYLMNLSDQYNSLSHKINKIEENINSLEDNFSTMMFQIDEFSKQTMENFRKVQEFLVTKQTNDYRRNYAEEQAVIIKKEPEKIYESKVDIHPALKASFPQVQTSPINNTTISNNSLENTMTSLKNVHTLNQNIATLELEEKNLDEIAKTLRMSKGEIELVKQLSKIRK